MNEKKLGMYASNDDLITKLCSLVDALKNNCAGIERIDLVDNTNTGRLEKTYTVKQFGEDVGWIVYDIRWTEFKPTYERVQEEQQ